MKTKHAKSTSKAQPKWTFTNSEPLVLTVRCKAIIRVLPGGSVYVETAPK